MAGKSRAFQARIQALAKSEAACGDMNQICANVSSQLKCYAKSDLIMAEKNFADEPFIWEKSMTPEFTQLIARYNQWMNQRMYEAASRLGADQLMKDQGAFFGSVFGTLQHIAVADLVALIPDAVD